jgi:hypothetical protein
MEEQKSQGIFSKRAGLLGEEESCSSLTANDEDEGAVIAFTLLNKDLEELRREGGG